MAADDAQNVQMPWTLLLGSLLVAGASFAWPEARHLYNTVRCVAPGDQITSFEAPRPGGCWAAFNVSMGDSWDAGGASCLGACGGCDGLDASTRWTLHCAEDAACDWYAAAHGGGSGKGCGRTWRAHFQDYVVTRLLGKCVLDTSDYIRHYVRAPGDAAAGAAPPQLLIHDHPCHFPLNHLWKHKRSPAESLYAFLHRQTALSFNKRIAVPLRAALGLEVAPAPAPAPPPPGQSWKAGGPAMPPRIFDEDDD